MSTQVDRATATRAKIMGVARLAFVSDGYDGVSLEKISKDAGVTKGALYHHYNGKEALFAALFSMVSLEVVTAVRKQTAGLSGSPRAQLKAAAITWLRTIELGDARTVLLDLGPRVLGFKRVRELEDEVALTPLIALVEAVIRAEKLKGGVDGLLAARLINAALSEIAISRHTSNGQTPSTEIAEEAVSGVIDGLLKAS